MGRGRLSSVLVFFFGGGGGGHSGRLLYLRPRGRRFVPHRHQYVLSLSKTNINLLNTGSTEEDPSRHS